MPNFQIFTDGSADIAPQSAAKHNITVIPFYVSLDGKTYQKEVVELSVEDHYKAFITGNVFPKTSLPSVQDYIDAFTPCLDNGNDILCFNLTTSLSSSHQSALTAKGILEEKYENAKILILNSWAASGLQELIIMEALKMKNNNFSIEEVWENCMKLRDKGRVMFMVGGLDHLEKGGRIGKVGAAAGGILKIKPLIELKDSEIHLAGIVRNRRAGLKKIADLVGNYFASNKENPEDYNFALGETNTPEELAVFESELNRVLPDIDFSKRFIIGATISSHTGPGTIGACFMKRYEKL